MSDEGRHLRDEGDFVWPVPSRTRRPSGWWCVGLFGIGLLLLASFAISVSVVSSRSDGLRESGGRATGQVVSLTPDQKGSEGSAQVRYQVAGRAFEEHVDLGADVDSYELNQQVQVFYDHEDPSVMTIDDEDNQSATSVVGMIAALVGGVFAVGGSIWLGGRWLAAHVRRRSDQPSSD